MTCLDFAEGQLLVLALPHRFDAASAQEILQRLKNSRADGVWLAASLLYRGDDKRRLARLHRLALAAKVPLLATNEVLYHHPARRPLQDVLTCIREKTTIDAVGRRLEANAERYLKPAHEMARLFRDLPEAIAETMRFAGRITLFARPAQIPISGRAGAAGQDRAAASGRPDLGRRRHIFRRRDRRHAARHLAQGTRADRRARTTRIISSPCTTSSITRAARTSCARAGARRRTRPSATCSASPRSIRPRSICCSSASSPRSGWSRPTSTSISSIRGARR